MDRVLTVCRLLPKAACPGCLLRRTVLDRSNARRPISSRLWACRRASLRMQKLALQAQTVCAADAEITPKAAWGPEERLPKTRLTSLSGILNKRLLSQHDLGNGPSGYSANGLGGSTVREMNRCPGERAMGTLMKMKPLQKDCRLQSSNRK